MHGATASEAKANPHSQHGDSVRRAFNLAGLVGLGSDGYSSLQPVQWPVRANNNMASDTAGDTTAPGTARPFRRSPF